MARLVVLMAFLYAAAAILIVGIFLALRQARARPYGKILCALPISFLIAMWSALRW